MPDERSDLLAGLSRFRDQQFAQWITIALHLAVERCPDEMRASLAQLFDIKGIKKDYENMVRDTFAVRQDLEQIREEIRLAKKELDELRTAVRKSQEYLSRSMNGKAHHRT